MRLRVYDAEVMPVEQPEGGPDLGPGAAGGREEAGNQAKYIRLVVGKALKVRIYPTESQKLMIAKTIGCCRKVYNEAQSTESQNISDGVTEADDRKDDRLLS